MENVYDIIVVGAGASGLTAAMFAARRGVSVLVLSKDMGGQAASASFIENYPGVERISGRDLMRTFYEQAKKSGVQFLWEEIKNFQSVSQGFEIQTINKKILATAMVCACGLVPRDLGVPGEQEFQGKGVVYSVVDHDDIFNKKNVVVAGGGNSALSGALHIASVSKKVYLVHRREHFRAEAALVEQARSLHNIEFVLNAKITQIRGEEKLREVFVEQDGREKIIQAEALYVAIGFQPRMDWIQGNIEITSGKEISTAGMAYTSLPGFFAAGDITNSGWKQLVVAAGEGCKAGLSAARYVCAKQAREFKAIDWS